jgi:zinc protease
MRVTNRRQIVVSQRHRSTLRARTLLTALLACTLAATSRGQAPAPAIDLGEDIPIDRAVQVASLPNGLRYYLRSNDRPDDRVALRLAVKAGSLGEAEDQQGLAHFLEHMAFNGSAHFAPGELVSYFESTGARLGPHVNAYTSFDETVYMLDLPTDRPDIVSRGLDALADFAGGLTIDPEQVDKERGVVVEEWRGRLGAGSRIRDLQIPFLYYKSRYAERLPIGQPEVLKSAPAARLRDFYDAWYRPDRMALVVVGDVENEATRKAIEAAFGPLKSRAPAPAPPDDAVPLHDELLVSVASDPELTASSVQLVTKHPREEFRTARDYRRLLIGSLFERMFNDRFAELVRRPGAAFLSAGVGDGPLTPEVNAFTMSARVPDGNIAAALTALAIEARRVREHGFTAPELERAKSSMAAFYERAYNERNRTESSSYAQEYLNHFLVDEPTPGIEYEYRLLQQVLPGIALTDVATLGRALLGEGSRVILATAPRKDDTPLPSEADLRAALRAADTVEVTPWSETTSRRTLMETKPAPGTVTSRREIADIGVTVVRFSNGVEAYLKPTDFKNDQVLFTMYADGGASLAGADDFVDATLATSYVGLSGLDGIRELELEKLLAGKLASASPFISLSTHGISGSAAPAQLETALQLLYLTFTAPGDDPPALALMKRQLDAAVANRGRSPNQVFRERIDLVNTSSHYTAQPLTPERVAALDRAKMMSFYKERFSNAADFTLFVVGAFGVNDVLPLLSQYVGSLPSTGSQRSGFKDVGIRFPQGVLRERVAKGTEPRSQTVISFAAEPSPDSAEQERVIAATTVLDIVLRDVLREDLGQTYTVSVAAAQSWPQRGGHMQVTFGAAPENIAAMTDRVLEEIKRLQTDGPSEDLASRARETARRGYETALKQNAYWMGRLQRIHMLGADPSEILTRPARIEAVTPAILRETFRQYFPSDRYTVVTLVPEA